MAPPFLTPPPSLPAGTKAEEGGPGEEGGGAGHRVLVFAQLRGLLDLVESDVLRPLGVSFLRIDGGVDSAERFRRCAVCVCAIDCGVVCACVLGVCVLVSGRGAEGRAWLCAQQRKVRADAAGKGRLFVSRTAGGSPSVRAPGGPPPAHPPHWRRVQAFNADPTIDVMLLTTQVGPASQSWCGTALQPSLAAVLLHPGSLAASAAHCCRRRRWEGWGST